MDSSPERWRSNRISASPDNWTIRLAGHHVLHGFVPQGRLHLDDAEVDDAGEEQPVNSTHAAWLDKLVDDWEVVKPKKRGKS
jgi:hypothetical protein